MFPSISFIIAIACARFVGPMSVDVWVINDCYFIIV